jgi:hypothetical protein
MSGDLVYMSTSDPFFIKKMEITFLSFKIFEKYIWM